MNEKNLLLLLFEQKSELIYVLILNIVLQHLTTVHFNFKHIINQYLWIRSQRYLYKRKAYFIYIKMQVKIKFNSNDFKCY
jgi:hypothetical protein